LDVSRLLNPKRTHAFFECGDIQWLLARRGQTVVGRVAAIQNHAHNKHHDDRTGFFGFFESEDDEEVSRALFDAAGDWARARGLEALRGPTSPSLNYETGCLVDGEPGAPFLMMPHNPPFYGRLMEGQGFSKVMDLYSFYTDREGHNIDRWRKLGAKILARNNATLRRFDTSRFRQEIQLIVELFNDAWSRNWGFVPMSNSEIESMARELRPVFAPWLCSFLVRDGEVIGFWMGLPNYNRVLIKLAGRLLPFGVLKLLRAKRQLKEMRVLLMGVRKEHQHLGLDAALYGDILETGQHGIEAAECGWVLETNTPMINTLERAGGRRWRTYRLYDKQLTP